MTRIAILAAVALASSLVGHAAEQTNPTKAFALKSPLPGGDMTKRRLLFKADKSMNTVVGNPTVSGATLHVRVGTNNEQCFDLPAAKWVAVGPLGYRYQDFDGPGAVIAASIKRTPSACSC